MRTKVYHRNTPTERRCPECEGAGTITVQHYTRNPELETDALCPHPDCINGWIRTVPRDPMERLKLARQHSRCSWGAKAYGELLQRIVSPVNLPRDVRPVELRAAA